MKKKKLRIFHNVICDMKNVENVSYHIQDFFESLS